MRFKSGAVAMADVLNGITPLLTNQPLIKVNSDGAQMDMLLFISRCHDTFAFSEEAKIHNAVRQGGIVGRSSD